MKKAYLLAAAAAAIVAAAPSIAATNITMTPTSTGSAGGFFNTVSGSFTDDYTFSVPGMGTVGSTVITVNLGNTVTLTSVLLNSIPLTITNNGTTYTAMGTAATITNPQTLSISGSVTGTGAYGGTVSFTAGAVPEAATWAMMLVGFGAVGGALRTSRRKFSFA